VPSSIIKIFDLEEGDKLRWQLEAVKKNEFIVRLEPVKAKKESIGNRGEGARIGDNDLIGVNRNKTPSDAKRL